MLKTSLLLAVAGLALTACASVDSDEPDPTLVVERQQPVVERERYIEKHTIHEDDDFDVDRAEVDVRVRDY